MSGTPSKPQSLSEPLRAVPHALNAKELSRLLGVGVRTIYREVDNNRIPHFRIATSIRFDPLIIAAWLDSKQVAR